jgi:anti-sigma factor ChrR (cupin superfamily)
VGELHEILNLKFENLQSFEALTGWPVNEKRTVDGIQISKLIQEKDKLVFLTEMPPLSRFPEHWHDTEEECEIVFGFLADGIFKKEWRKGQVYKVDKFVRHEPFNPSKTDWNVLIVTFRK